MKLTAALIALLFIAPTLTNCSKVDFFRPKTDGPGIVPQSGCDSHSFNQPIGGYDKVDILFVTDTSGSLDSMRATVAASIGNLADELDVGVDYQVAVLMGHGSMSAHTGSLWQSPYNEPLILKSSELNVAEIEEGLIRKLQNIENDFWADGGELNMFSLTNLVTGAGLIQAKSQGFFRSDAALSVIFLADENDLCAEYPHGVIPAPDWDCWVNGVHTNDGQCDIEDTLEYIAEQRDCGGISAQSVMNNLWGVVGERPMLVGGIIYLDPATIPDIKELEVGYGYTDMLDLAGPSPQSVAIDLATDDIPASLSVIGELTNNNLQYTTSYVIQQAGVIEQQVGVTIDNDVQTLGSDYTYDADLQRVDLLFTGGPGAHVEIEWCFETSK